MIVRNQAKILPSTVCKAERTLRRLQNILRHVFYANSLPPCTFPRQYGRRSRSARGMIHRKPAAEAPPAKCPPARTTSRADPPSLENRQHTRRKGDETSWLTEKFGLVGTQRSIHGAPRLRRYQRQTSHNAGPPTQHRQTCQPKEVRGKSTPTKPDNAVPRENGS